MSAHTPGPWFVQQKPGCAFQIADHENPYVSTILCTRFEWEAKSDEMAANGRLIAAAPELLMACQLIVAAFDNLKPVSAARNEPLQINAARAAILKATGAQP